MAVLLPLISLIFLFLTFRCRDNCWRSSILSAAIVWGLLLTAITEILSLGRLLTFEWLVRVWVLIDSALILTYFRAARSQKHADPMSEGSALPLPSILLLCSVVFVVVIVGLVALMSPPNNWDSMSYRMARVVHWIQNHSVAYYPTSYLPQLYQKPWSEFTIMHLQILSGGDRFANLVQWFSMIGSVIGVSLIAKQLGADLRGQILSAAVCVTIPMGILQASSTQGDYVVSFWLICFVYCVLSAVQETEAVGVNSFKTGTSLGLAFLAKATAYIYAFPFFIWLLISIAKRYKWKAWKSIFVIAALVFLINIGHEIRNVDLFGRPLASGTEKYTNEIFSVSVLLSNVIKNICLHIYIPIETGKNFAESTVRLIHTLLGIAVSDPRTTWFEFQFPSRIGLFHEDTAPNTIHLFTIVGAIVLFLKGKFLKVEKNLSLYLICLISDLLLFCLLLKWQLWHSRLHLPLFVLFSAFVGTVLSKALADHLIRDKVLHAVASILVLSSLPWVFCNQTRPLVSSFDRTIFSPSSYANIFNTSRTDQYFINRKYLTVPYVEATSLINSSSCSSVGLSLEGSDWEYPLWMLLQKNTQKQYRIEQLNVKNVSANKSQVYPHKDFTPCSMIFVEHIKHEKLPEGIPEEIKVRTRID